MGRCRNDAGQVTLLAVMAMGAVLVFGLAVVALGHRIVERAEAQTTADVVALAAVAHGADAGRSLAVANGRAPGEVQIQTWADAARTSARVDVTVDGGTVSAQAEAAVAQIEGLIPALAAAMARAEQLVGQPITITSGWRSPADQERLWAQRATNPFPVAPPGTSLHERGMAVDIAVEHVPLLLSVADQLGICQPLPVTDPIHFTWCAGGLSG